MLNPSNAHLIFALAATLAVVGQLFVLRDAVAGQTPASGTTRAARLRELLWIAIPALVLALVVLATWRALPVRDRGAVPVREHARPARAARLTPAGS